LAASAWAIAGDTIAVARLTDSVGVFGAKSANGRDRRLVHHLRGLLAESRADDATAVREFRSAIYSMTEGYVRTNEELARVLLRLNRASEAVPLLQASVRGNVEASALYRNRTESEALLAEAFARSGARDSARVHYQIVATRWMGGDPAYRQRAVDAARQVATLGGTGR
jgi:hypothetical protein